MSLKKFLPLTGLLFLLIVGGMLLPVNASETPAMVSPALEILSSESGMAKACVGEELGFDAADFERALNVSELSYITVTSVPNKADGALFLGGVEVSEGQVISRANISYLTFSFMNEAVKDSAFCFSTNLGGYEIECSMYSLAYENRVPVINETGTAAMAVSTYRDVVVFGEMSAYDPDGDAMTYEIIEYPANGILKVTDRSSGAYQYVPNVGYTGKDVFRYVAVDQYGNYSVSKKVSLEISGSATELVYKDLISDPSHVAAISLTEKGIMASTELGGENYFHPDEEVTRAEFLVMAMKTVGIQSPTDPQATVFSDDSDIPEAYRGYVDTAQKLGYVCGRINEKGELVFAPNETITRAEAATILYNMVSLDVPVFKPMFMDADTVPIWATDAISATTAAGILKHNTGYISADSPVTRGQCAEMLYRLDKLAL